MLREMVAGIPYCGKHSREKPSVTDKLPNLAFKHH